MPPNFIFDPKRSIILCYAEIVGKRTEFSLKMALDTGATYTMIPTEAAAGIGCNPIRAQRKIEITTGSGIEYLPLVIIPKFRAFGVTIRNFEVGLP